MDVESVKQRVKDIALGMNRPDVLAAGIFGSLARGDFHEKSDIDIFVISEKELPLNEEHGFYYIFSRLTGEYKRDVTVMVYDLETLKKIPCWQTLNMIREAQFVCDRAGIENLFKRILRDEAKAHGIVYDAKHKVFRLQRPGRVVFSLDS